jgi:predicted permease
MPIVTTLIPIFVVVFAGWLARRNNLMPDEFMGPANRLVYYLAIPAMIFRAIAGASLKTQFDAGNLAVTLTAVLLVFGAARLVAAAIPAGRRETGVFIQCSFHGNLGYVGLAVAYYYLGSAGLVEAGIIAGFIMILQNLLAVYTLNRHATDQRHSGGIRKLALGIFGNPIILAALAGIFWALSDLPLPMVLDRCLAILSGMALPLALLLIGASISFDRTPNRLGLLIVAGFLKLVLLPGLGLALCRVAGISAHDFLPGLILLASPTATVTYVMAKEMGGDTEFAVSAISLSTIFSALTFMIWLGVTSG